jgi:hypothetical protein
MPASGAMLVQLAVDNDAGELLPGAFATARFDQPACRRGRQRAAGRADHRQGWRAALRRSTPATACESEGDDCARPRQRGATGRRAAGDRIIDSPPDGIADGDLVRIAALDKKVEP